MLRVVPNSFETMYTVFYSPQSSEELEADRRETGGGE